MNQEHAITHGQQRNRSAAWGRYFALPSAYELSELFDGHKFEVTMSAKDAQWKQDLVLQSSPFVVTFVRGDGSLDRRPRQPSDRAPSRKEIEGFDRYLKDNGLPPNFMGPEHFPSEQGPNSRTRYVTNFDDKHMLEKALRGTAKVVIYYPVARMESYKGASAIVNTPEFQNSIRRRTEEPSWANLHGPTKPQPSDKSSFGGSADKIQTRSMRQDEQTLHTSPPNAAQQTTRASSQHSSLATAPRTTSRTPHSNYSRLQAFVAKDSSNGNAVSLGARSGKVTVALKNSLEVITMDQFTGQSEGNVEQLSAPDTKYLILKIPSHGIECVDLGPGQATGRLDDPNSYYWNKEGKKVLLPCLKDGKADSVPPAYSNSQRRLQYSLEFQIKETREQNEFTKEESKLLAKLICDIPWTEIDWDDIEEEYNLQTPGGKKHQDWLKYHSRSPAVEKLLAAPEDDDLEEENDSEEKDDD